MEASTYRPHLVLGGVGEQCVLLRPLVGRAVAALMTATGADEAAALNLLLDMASADGVGVYEMSVRVAQQSLIGDTRTPLSDVRPGPA